MDRDSRKILYSTMDYINIMYPQIESYSQYRLRF